MRKLKKSVNGYGYYTWWTFKGGKMTRAWISNDMKRNHSWYGEWVKKMQKWDGES